MEPLAGWDALQRLTASVARDGPGYSTNLYAGRDELGRWCSEGAVRVLAADGAVLLLRADRRVRRLYHVARDDAALAAALRQLPPGQYAADIVGRGAPLERVCEAYAAGGFAHHTFLRRMSRAAIVSTLSAGGDVALARPRDCAEVASFLDRLLDPLSEQPPPRAELDTAAREGRLLLVRQREVLAGMLMYDKQGQHAHLRFWHVAPDAQGGGIGRRLMASFLSRCADARRIVLWVIGDNHRSIAVYRHYGFETDGLLDCIMALNKD